MIKSILIGAAVAAGLAQTSASPRTVVFPADRAAALAAQCSRRVPGPISGTWLPDTTVIRRTEEALGPAFEAALQKSGANPALQYPLNEYFRQYGGLIVGDRRIVYVNAFHEKYLKLGEQLRRPPPLIEWQTVPVNICDGWTLFFGAQYDVASGIIEAVTFNGRAGPDPQMQRTRP